jgi:hypothetical protein
MTDKKPSPTNLDLSFSQAMRASINRALELKWSAERVMAEQSHNRPNDRPEDFFSLCKNFDISSKRFEDSLEAVENAKDKPTKFGMSDQHLGLTKTFFNHMHALGNVLDPALDICIEKKALNPPKFLGGMN